MWILAAALTVAVIAGLVLLGRRRNGAAKAALIGVATGMASGLIAVLTNAVLTSAAGGGIRGVFTTWWTYLLILTVPVGFFLLQGALQAGRLVASQPGITLANTLVAAVWGIGIFGEHVRTGGWLIGALLGALLIGAGAVLLAAPHCSNGCSSRRDQGLGGVGAGVDHSAAARGLRRWPGRSRPAASAAPIVFASVSPRPAAAVRT